jgi:hypothetical protein
MIEIIFVLGLGATIGIGGVVAFLVILMDMQDNDRED